MKKTNIERTDDDVMKPWQTCLSWLALATMVILSVVSLWVGYTQREERRAALAERDLISQQQMEQLAQQEAAEKEKIAAEAAQAASVFDMAPLPTPKPTPKPSPKPQENSTITGPGGDVVVNQPEYAKPTPPPAPTPAPTPAPGQTTPTPTDPPAPTPKPQPSQPKNGTERINADGVLEIYMQGFGWITSGGPNETTPAHNAGTGEVIGF